MEFPTKSKQTTSETYTFEEVRGLMDRLHFARAEYLASILLALQARFGDEVMKIAGDAIFEIGRHQGQQLGKLSKDKSLADFAEGFMGDKFDRPYWGYVIEQSSDKLVTGYMEYCPLPRKWKDMGLPDDQIQKLCSTCDNIDKGLAAGYPGGVQEENSGVRTLSTEGRCRMTIKRLA